MAEKRKVWRVKDASGAIEQVLIQTSAEQVTVADTANKITATNVEAALQELATNIANAGKVDDVKDVNGNSIVTNKVATLSKAAVGLDNVTNDAQVKRSEMGANGGVATLDLTGKVPSSQLPSYVDDVLEYDNETYFPETGASGKIYVSKHTNLTYRWSGTAYVEISPSLALGETESTAYAGNKGKANADEIAKIKNGTTKVKKAEQADSATNATNATVANSALTANKVNHTLTIQNDGSNELCSVTYDGGGANKLVVFQATDFDSVQDDGADSITFSLASICTAGSYSAVTVDATGRVNAGGQSIEWGASGVHTPSTNLMVGGLFFELQ